MVLWILGLAGILLFERWEAIPFHLIWVTFALLYSFRVRTTGATLWVLAAMAVTTFAAIGFDVLRGADSPAELTEVPLMAAMVWVMLWHGRRRLAANADRVRVSEENEQLAGAAAPVPAGRLAPAQDADHDRARALRATGQAPGR